MKIKNTIVAVAIGLFGTISTQAKNFSDQNNNVYSIVSVQEPPAGKGSTNDDKGDGGGIIYDINPPIYDLFGLGIGR